MNRIKLGDVMFSVVADGKKISRIFITILLFSVLILSLVLTVRCEDNEKGSIKLTSIEKRANFLNSLGYDTDTAVSEEEKEILIPYEFSDVYKSYNALQQSAGYDLLPFAGNYVKQYTIKLKVNGRNDVYAHLLLYNEILIGGDITALSLDDGYMLPLENKDKKQE